ncbi:phosphate-starvation-inducible protein PsiE [Magnetovibrio blakemorei]|uniref:Protein PsiE n=1 Tax=Magnetovibrio blakemorei TaxID=28181 RepID=A0A1E5Q581_9PROT|nr:phosphate-starvation-inducible PsiE family protein [Magnetovibrio blakemorei]OEJ65197.1 phosphate-starvation-inducible E [Magnetovibrio blakemorei]
MTRGIEKIGGRALSFVEKAGLLLIAVATVIAIGQEVMLMVQILQVRLADLLLLFIYLEVLAMVNSYLQAGSLPVRMPLYIAMVALARFIVLDVKSMDNLQLIAVTGGIFIISLAVLAIRYGHVHYPYGGASIKENDEV